MNVKLSQFDTMKTGVCILVALLIWSSSVFGFQVTHFVNAAGTSPVAPYTTWATAATNIQDAIDASSSFDMVLVTNGFYQYGGNTYNLNGSNCVSVVQFLAVRSVNGPAFTTIKGSAIKRCAGVYLGATLSGFTLTNGTASAGQQWGGGVFCDTSAIVTNCIIVGNSAPGLGGGGGGAYQGNLIDCVISNNTTQGKGGGTLNSYLVNCLVAGNSATAGTGGGGGGCYSNTLINCTIVGNVGAGGGGVMVATLTNCVLSGNSVVSGFTGGGAYRSMLNSCTIMFNSAGKGGGVANSFLTNCSIVSNSAAAFGGGAYSSFLTNCLLAGNVVTNGSPGGGGGAADSSTLYNCHVSGNSSFQCGALNNSKAYRCIIDRNSAVWDGGVGSDPALSVLYNCLVASNSAATAGGAASSKLYNCTVIGNFATNGGGGLVGCYSYNCVVFYNNAANSPNYSGSTLNYSCTTPLPAGLGNITNEPQFVDMASGDFHLQSNSPCINSGNNAFMSLTNDLDGNTRISGGTVDLGAYEYPNPPSILSYAWAQQYGLAIDGSTDNIDSDGDGLSNWQEWLAGTNPTNAAFVLELLAPALTNNPAGITVTWQSVTNRTYFLDRSGDLSSQPQFNTILSNLVGQAGTTSVTDSTATNAGPYFYRVGVQ